MLDFKSYRLYEQGADSQWRIIRLISRDEGERMVRSKTARAGLDWDGVTLCFQLIETSQASAVPAFVPANLLPAREEDMAAEVSSSAFSKAEVQAIAGSKFRHGRSRTARMTDAQRKARKGRYGKPLPMEDLAERASNKYTAWAQIPVLLDRVREVASL